MPTTLSRARSQESKSKEAVAPRLAGIERTTFVRYIDRTREYYRAQGYERPYRWASFNEVPFTPLSRPLSESTVTIITTANEWSPAGRHTFEDRPARRVHAINSSEPPVRFHTDDLSWHKEATHTDDLDSYFPIHRLRELVETGRLGAVAARCHGVPTRYSQRQTLESDAPEILRRCREDRVDLALLVPL